MRFNVGSGQLFITTLIGLFDVVVSEDTYFICSCAQALYGALSA